MKEIIVLGSARCGTSVVAGTLKLMGVNMDARLNKNRHNPNGDYESLKANEINNKIFIEANGGMDFGNHNHWFPPKEGVIESLIGVFEKEIKDFVREKKGLWGWKNPKTTLTIEHYLSYLQNPHFVCVYRNLKDASNSAIKMTGGYLGFDEFLDVHSQYYKYLAEFISYYKDEYPFFHISYEDIIKDEPIETWADGLAEFIGVKGYKVDEIEDFIIHK